MIRLDMKNCCTILAEKQQKYQHYHQVKINMHILQVLPSDQSRIIEQAKFTYCPLGKVFEQQIKPIENQGEKQIKANEEHGKQLRCQI